MKIGDKVKVIKNNTQEQQFNEYIGKIGIVNEIFTKGRCPIYVDFEFDLCGWDEDELELVED